MRSDVLNGNSSKGSKEKSQVISLTPVASEDMAYTLTSDQSGALVVCNAAASSSSIAIKLPTPEAGLRYKFVIADTGSNDVTVTSTSDGSSAANLCFFLGDIASTVYSVATAADVLTFGDSSNNHTIGDWAECWCDGTNWYYTGHAVVASSLTLA